MDKREVPKLVCCLVGLCFVLVTIGSVQADTASVNTNWGGHLRTIGTVSDIDDDSIYAYVDKGRYYDGQLELRLKNSLYFGTQWTVETHYELVALGGDTREKTGDLENALSVTLPPSFYPSQTIDDDHRLFRLTRQFSREDEYLAYHRLDRLNIHYIPPWGTLRLGRQALTWGDGLVFNPMDLFNPFAPNAVQRDYKVGDDMAHLAVPFGPAEMQLLYVPRRDPDSGDLAEDRASYAMKYHGPAGPLEIDLMAARHYDEGIAGIGASGYVKDAAWRVNATYAHLSDESSQTEFFQVVANIDYAWLWGGKNIYGLVEFYYNGLGRTDDYEKTLSDTSLVQRLERGELYTLGRHYLAGQLQVELHPLVRFHTMAITNLHDPSGLIQPQILWDITGDLQAILGTQYYWGGSHSEYGGFDIILSDTTIPVAPSSSVYIWLTRYF